MIISDLSLNNIIRESVESVLREKKEKTSGEKETRAPKVKISKKDQKDIKNKIVTKDGKNAYNVSALADKTGYTQSYVNRCIKGGVKNGDEGFVKYNMPKKLADQLNSALTQIDKA